MTQKMGSVLVPEGDVPGVTTILNTLPGEEVPFMQVSVRSSIDPVIVMLMLRELADRIDRGEISLIKQGEGESGKK
jgi:hypothetical protein